MIIEEKNLTGDKLIETVNQICVDKDEMRQMGRNAAKFALIDANERIYDAVMELVKS